MDVLARYESLVDDYEAFLAACEEPLPTTVRVSAIKAAREADDTGDSDGEGHGDGIGDATGAVERVRAALAAEGVDSTPVAWNPRLLRVDTDGPGTTWPYVHGWINGQEEVSALPPVVLDPQPGEVVWDACAAPGSKTTQLADLMADCGLVVANDNNLGRLSALRSNAERVGATCVAVTKQDARNYSLAPFEREHFDRALVDAPCSCEGTVRKNPDVFDEWSMAHVESVSGVQKGILRRAVQATKPGGVVVYGTCTFAPEENEAVVQHALDETDCRLVDYETGLATRPGITEWDGERFDDDLRKAKRVYPHLNDTGGFFCAKLEVGG